MIIEDKNRYNVTLASSIDHRGIYTLFFAPSATQRLLYIGDALCETIEPDTNYFNLYYNEKKSFLFDFVGKTTIRLEGEQDLILNIHNTKIEFEIFEQIITTLEKEAEGITFSAFGYNEYSINTGNSLLFDMNKFKKIQFFLEKNKVILKKIIRNPNYKFVKNYLSQSDAKKIDRHSIAMLSKKSYQATGASEYPKIQFSVNQQDYSVPTILNVVNEFSFETSENLCILSLLYAYLNFLNAFKEKLVEKKKEQEKENKIYANDDSFSRKQKEMRKKRQDKLLKTVDETKTKILQYYHLLSDKIGYNNHKTLASVSHYFSQSHHIFYSLPLYRSFTTHIKSWLDNQQSLEKDNKNYVSLQNINKIYEIYVLYAVFQSIIFEIGSNQKNDFQMLWGNKNLRLYGVDVDCEIIYDKPVNEALPNFIDRLKLEKGEIRPDVILKFTHHQNNTKEFILIIDAKFTDNPIYSAKELTWKYLYRLFPKQEKNTIIAGLIIASPLLTSKRKSINDDFKNWASKDNMVEYASEKNALCFGNQSINMPYIQIIKSIPDTLNSFKKQIQNLVLWIEEDNEKHQQQITNHELNKILEEA